MKKVKSLDVTIKGYKEYNDNIIKTYPKQFVSLIIKEKDNGHEDVFVESIYGVLGELFSEDGREIIPFLKEPQKYYIDAFIKKSYCKEIIYEALILVINVYEKEKGFVEPKKEFLGNYVSNYDKYTWWTIIDGECEIKCSISNQNPDIVEEIEDYDNAKLVINGDVVDVYFFSYLVGSISKKSSEEIISYLKNENIDVTPNFRISESRDTYQKRARLLIDLEEKKYLELSEYIKDKSLLIDGVQVVRKVRQGNYIRYFSVDDKDLDNPNLEAEIAKQEEKESRRGCFIISLVIVVFILLFYLNKDKFSKNEVPESKKNYAKSDYSNPKTDTLVVLNQRQMEVNNDSDEIKNAYKILKSDYYYIDTEVIRFTALYNKFRNTEYANILRKTRDSLSLEQKKIMERVKKELKNKKK